MQIKDRSALILDKRLGRVLYRLLEFVRGERRAQPNRELEAFVKSSFPEATFSLVARSTATVLGGLARGIRPLKLKEMMAEDYAKMVSEQL